MWVVSEIVDCDASEGLGFTHACSSAFPSPCDRSRLACVMGEEVFVTSNGDQQPVARRLPGRYGGAWGVTSVLAIVVGWLFLLGSVLVPQFEVLLFVGVALCSGGFLMEFFLRSAPMKAD